MSAPTKTDLGPSVQRALGTCSVDGAANYLDERASISGLVTRAGRKTFSDQWSFMIGAGPLYSLVAILLSAAFLTFDDRGP